MIRNDNEYRDAVARIKDERKRIDSQGQELAKTGLGQAEIDRVLDPMRSFHMQLVEEAQSYERLRRGEIDELKNLRGFGQLLICLRIASGLSQRELAERLEVHETQVSRDERNEYHGITVDRAAKILEALGVKIRIQAEVPDDDAVHA